MGREETMGRGRDVCCYGVEAVDRGGRWVLLVGLLVVMERPEEEKVDGWREGGGGEA